MEKNRLSVIVRPNSKKNEIVEINGKTIRANIAAPAEKNRANIELVKLLSRKLKKKVKIVSGLSGRKKTVEITTNQ